MLRVHFHGACRSVTGSCYLLEHENTQILIDCGMVQGSKTEKELNYRAFPFRPASVDALLLTHAHIDHSGLIPKLVKDGFEGPIFATGATADLCSIMLPDSAHIQDMEVKQLNRRNARRGEKVVEPIYSMEDTEKSLTQFKPVHFGKWVDVAKGFRARYWDAGHLLGSASIEIEAVSCDGKTTRLLFSGDIGSNTKLFHDHPDAPKGVDHLICESTYGDVDRHDGSLESRRQLLLNEILLAHKSGGPLIIPSFAVERTQELLVDIVDLMDSGAFPQTAIFIDSPLASRASDVFSAHANELEHGKDLERAMRHPMLRFTESTDQSKAIAKISGFHIIMAASGMCDAGRIRHHLSNWLWHHECVVLLVGFQAKGTLGRILQEGAQRVRIMGDEIQVRASIRSLDIYSGHADGSELVAWVESRKPIGGNIFLVHGEERAMTAMQARIEAHFDPTKIILPTLDEAFDLGPTKASAVETGIKVRLLPEHVAHHDWHNDLSSLILDLGEALRNEADEKGRARLIRRMRRALEASDSAPTTSHSAQ